MIGIRIRVYQNLKIKNNKIKNLLKEEGIL